MKRISTRFMLAAALLALGFTVPAQNVIQDGRSGKTAPPLQISTAQVDETIRRTPDFAARANGPEAERVRTKLESHVRDLLEGAPWMPFHHTLGISGYEAYFNHPDELFWALSIALPQLTPERQAQVRDFLGRQLENNPPCRLDGLDNRAGRPRESYQVPNDLRLPGRGKAPSVFGVHALWAYVHHANDRAALRVHWPEIIVRMRPLIEEDDAFDFRKGDDSKDEAEKLNGDLAGLIGFVRLALANRDQESARAARRRLAQLLELRVNLDRLNPRILEKTTASKSLHISKLARFCDLTPEVGDAVRQWTDGCAAAQLQAFREARNTWHLAFGDRLVGGENYTNPLHFSRAMFAGAAFVEQLPAEQVLKFVDVPWCRADLYFIEKCAYALWCAAGRPWIELE